MSEEKKPLGFFVDGEGDFSSGRLIKVIAVSASVLLAITVSILSIFDSIDIEKLKLLREIISAFLLLAGSAETIQKSLDK